jgi:hypothetical protein
MELLTLSLGKLLVFFYCLNGYLSPLRNQVYVQKNH